MKQEDVKVGEVYKNKDGYYGGRYVHVKEVTFCNLPEKSIVAIVTSDRCLSLEDSKTSRGRDVWTWQEFSNTFEPLPKKKDYAKFVRLNDCGTFVIIGKQMLRTTKWAKEIIYSNVVMDSFDKKPKWEEVSVSELKYGDVVYLFPEDENMRLDCTAVFVGRTEEECVFNALREYEGIEHIKTAFLSNTYDGVPRKVIRFLREAEE